jgi:SAM-dependent methyltransferase
VELKMDIKTYYDGFTDIWVNFYGSLLQTALFAPEPVDHCRVMMGRGLISPGHSVLDVGCGVGGVMSGLMENGVEDVTGVTISPRQVELAELSLELADFMEWDDAGRKFDRLILCESFGYFDEPGKLIEKCVGLLKPGGMIYVKDLCVVNDPDFMQQAGLSAIDSLWLGYNVYSTEEMIWMWGMSGVRRIGGGDNLWREADCGKFIDFVRGESVFAKAHRERLADMGRVQQPIWNGQLPVKASDFLFAM